jgi:hypothetical protein
MIGGGGARAGWCRSRERHPSGLLRARVLELASEYGYGVIAMTTFRLEYDVGVDDLVRSIVGRHLEAAMSVMPSINGLGCRSRSRLASIASNVRTPRPHARVRCLASTPSANQHAMTALPRAIRHFASKVKLLGERPVRRITLVGLD